VQLVIIWVQEEEEKGKDGEPERFESDEYESWLVVKATVRRHKGIKSSLATSMKDEEASQKVCDIDNYRDQDVHFTWTCT